MIGARDVAFPRLNALSYWIFLFGGSSSIRRSSSGPHWRRPGKSRPDAGASLSGSPNGGWFGYQPNAGPTYSVGTALDYWALGLQILGLASLISAVNFITTIFNLRARGMRLPADAGLRVDDADRGVPAALLSADHRGGALHGHRRSAVRHALLPTRRGGSAILWQHLFWLFGHPEVYILILPAMGIVSRCCPCSAESRSSVMPPLCSPAPPSPSSASGFGLTTCSHLGSAPWPRRRSGFPR